MSDEDQISAMGKLWGPIILFVGPPVLILTFISLVKKENALGVPFSVKACLFFVFLTAICLLFGVWLCNKGYGWFQKICSKLFW